MVQKILPRLFFGRPAAKVYFCSWGILAFVEANVFDGPRPLVGIVRDHLHVGYCDFWGVTRRDGIGKERHCRGLHIYFIHTNWFSLTNKWNTWRFVKELE